MRTTVTLDKDVERLLHDTMHRTRRSFKETLNHAIRSGLAAKGSDPTNKPFIIKAKAMHLRAGIDPANFNKLTDDLEVDGFLEKQEILQDR